MNGKPIDLLNELIPLRDVAKQVAHAASLNDEERLRELWDIVAYHFERVDIRIRPLLNQHRPAVIATSGETLPLHPQRNTT